MTTDIPPTGGLLVTSIFLGAVSSRACSGACKCCTGMAQSQGQHTLWGNSSFFASFLPCVCLLACLCFGTLLVLSCAFGLLFCCCSFFFPPLHGASACLLLRVPLFLNTTARSKSPASFLSWGHCNWKSLASQRSLHNAPIFRLLLKVAVNGTHQCDFPNFCGALGLQQL